MGTPIAGVLDRFKSKVKGQMPVNPAEATGIHVKGANGHDYPERQP